MNSIHLLDCNHKTSSEYIAGNRDSPAIFTNKLGSGIQVNPGDKVSVHNAFISETGSDDNAIQITNDFLETKSITYTKLTKHNEVNGSGDKVLGYERITAENITEDIGVYANKSSLLLNYYKTNNGENHYNLPRRFCYKNQETEAVDWTEYDTYATGRPGGNILLTSLNASFNGSNMSAWVVEDDHQFVAVLPRSEYYEYKHKMNNSRFQIFIAKDTRYGSQSETLTRLTNGSFTTPALLDYIEYIEKIDIEISTGFKSPEAIANSITEQLRKQSQPKVNFINGNGNIYAPVGLIYPLETSVEINSPTYHTFYAGSELTSNASIFDDYEEAILVTDEDNASTNAYLSSYQYIGVKRPELWLRGREWAKYYMDYRNAVAPGTVTNILEANLFNLNTLNASQFRVVNASTGGNSTPHTIVFSQEWDFNILNSLNKIFLEQANHPELFENRYNQLNGFTNVNNSRFLHMNALSKSNRPATAYKFQLGCDFYFQSASGVPYLNSVPLFFDFNPEYANKYTEGDSWEAGYSFGCFLKYNENGRSYIAITTSHMGMLEAGTAGTIDPNFTTIPNNLFSLSANGNITNFSITPGEAIIGWDCNFSSYGNLCIGLLDGWANQGFHTEEIGDMLPAPFNANQIPSSNYSQQIYLGANEPLLEYNTTSNRFELSNLHTAERVQNRFNAGGVADDTAHDQFIVNEFATAGDKVYKINKRLYNTNFTPNILPYNANRIDSLTIGTNKYQVDFLNPNLCPWVIYDQLTGIIIKDFGYSKNNFENGLWGVLGFIYEQFNASRSFENDITSRIGNNNKDNLPYALTNAEVGQLATMDFVTNIFGAGMYSLQLPLTMSFNATNTGGNQNDYFRQTLKFQQYPAITESAHSVKLSAPNLPRKLINPYFCIRTDLLDNADYIGGADSGEIYPVIAVVPKSNDYGDFFVNTSPDLEFVFTKSKTLTSIITSIHNPDQTLASVNDSSAVIYKITKAIPQNRFNIVGQILQENNKSKI